MNKIFLCDNPHPAHALLAKSIDCKFVENKKEGLGILPGIGRVFQSRAIIDNIEKYEPDLILTENTSRDLLCATRYKMKHPKTKVVAILADPKIYEFSDAPKFDKRLTIQSLAGADVLLVVSDLVKSYIPPQFWYKVHKFYPAIMDLETRTTNCATFCNKGFVFVGRLDEYKGVDLLLKNWVEVVKGFDASAKLTIAGDGKLKGIFRNQRILGVNYIGQTNDSLWMHECGHMYLSFARFEPSGVAVAEAMSQGLVPILSEGVGFKELLPEELSFLVTHSNKDIEFALKKLNDEEFWLKASNECIKIASKLTPENSVKEFKNALTLAGINFG